MFWANIAIANIVKESYFCIINAKIKATEATPATESPMPKDKRR
jgi:hypothetical protein